MTTEAIAQSVIPYNRDDARARYLGLRASGFRIREALKLVEKAQSTLSFWRLDPQFVDLENRIPEFRKELANEYANLEFLRNYRLVLEKDYRILKTSLYPNRNKETNKEEEMSPQDHQYLIKMRSHYTPQQLQIIESLMAQDNGAAGIFDFTNFVITATRTQERIQLEAKSMQGSVDELPEVLNPDE